MSIRDELAQIVDDVAEQATREGRITSPLEVVDAILDRFAVVGLPTLNDSDDDGQIYTDVAELRIDTTGRHGDEVFRGSHRISSYWLRREAAELLAAAKRAEAVDVDR